MLEIKDLHVNVENKEIIKGISLKIKKEEKVALMGKNGSGKSSLSNAIMGNPKYVVTKGNIYLNGEDITNLSPEERAKKGLFLSFQSPQEINGVTLSQFLRLSFNATKKENYSIAKFSPLLKQKMEELHMPPHFEERYLNENFSGGEKKKSEMLQMLLLEPKFAILDETDSGLDIDALKVIGSTINKSNAGFLIITHYERLLKEAKPDKVLILANGKIIKEGDATLATELENKGFNVI